MGLLLSGYDYTINTSKHSTIFIILKEFKKYIHGSINNPTVTDKPE